MAALRIPPAAALLVAATCCVWAADPPLYKDPDAAIEARIDDLLARMTLEEKIEQLGGTGMATVTNERLGIPGFKMSDGPHGVRTGQATGFPTSLAMASTWDPELVGRVGAALGREFRGKGRYVALGPCINVIRDPRGGRSFEGMGEDPYLIGRIAVAYIKGMQSEKVIAVAKHFACNNQEFDRGKTDVQIGERTLREFYLPHFEACVREAGVWGIMAAYNKVNGLYCTANGHLQRDILKGDWGFAGIIVSDWGACHATYGAITGGLDVEMPNRSFFDKPLLEAVQKGEVPVALINDAVRRTLRARFWAGVFEQPVEPDESKVNTPEHQALALETARKAVVLLKNEGNLLPLKRGQVKSIAVIGPNAEIARPTGGGSSQTNPYYAISPLTGILDRAGAGIQIDYAAGVTMDGDADLDAIPAEALTPLEGEPGQHGLTGDYFTNQELRGKAKLTRVDATVNFDWARGKPAEDMPSDGFSVRWQGRLNIETPGDYELGTTSDDGVRLFVDGQQLISDWGDHAASTRRGSINLEPGGHEIRLEYYENTGDAVVKLLWAKPGERGDGFAEVSEMAAKADVAIVVVGTSPRLETEGRDRSTLKLPPRQDELVQAVFKANKNTVVVNVSGSAVLMDAWIDSIPAVVQGWFNGQEAGHAIADVLFGDVNPGGKLPVTFPRTQDQLPSFSNQYETIGEGRGYRYYDKQEIEPLFPFGHGLSYTTFEYSNLKVEAGDTTAGEVARITIDIENTGDRAGDEVVQVYVRDVEAGLPRPVQELKGFRRVGLDAGEKQTVTLSLTARNLAFYDVNLKSWKVEPGAFEIRVGSSSRDIRAKATLRVQ